MRKILACSSIILALLQMQVLAQNRRQFKEYFIQGEYHFFLEEYDEALQYYTRLLDMDEQNHHILYLTGECYLNIPGKKSRAIPYLEEAIAGMSEKYKDGSYKERNAPNEALFSLARAYHINNQFSRASEFYVQYRQIMGDRSYADYEYVNQQIEACLVARRLMGDPSGIELVPVETGVSQMAEGYNPVVCANDSIILYMNDQEATGSIYMASRQGAGWSEPVLINPYLGALDNCLITCITADGKELYLTRTDRLDADIYVSFFEDGRWTEMERVGSPVSSGYYESHASLSGDGKVMYFTSNRRGGYGAMDIYRTERSKKDDWSQPENLGEVINTPYNEESPFITEDGQRLYFSSQGHQTMGGFDVFYSTLQPDGSWSYPVNPGYPLNSADDEVFYVPVDNGRDGLMASARGDETDVPGLYTVKYLTAEQMAARQQPEEEADQPQPGTDEAGPAAGNTTTKPAGERNLIVIRNILFDYNSRGLNREGIAEAEKIYRIMRDFPDITLEVTGHADSKGSAAYNMGLSQKRATAVTTYLAQKGIDKSRLIARGAGESNNIAINRNPDGSDNPEGRKLNRHARLRLLNFENENISYEDIFVPDRLRPGRDLRYAVLLADRQERIPDLPGELSGNPVRELETGDKYLYTAGLFRQKSDAVRLVNEATDLGFPEAQIMEERDLDRLIRKYSSPASGKPKKYTIQIMALKKNRDPSYFRNVPGVRLVKGRDGLNKYIVGEYSSVQEALSRLPEIKSLGYPDAFIMNMEHYLVK